MILQLLTISISHAILARMFGYGIGSRPIALIANMLPIVLVCAYVAGWWGALGSLGALGIATGHGQYLSVQQKTLSPEKVDPIVSLFFDHDPRASGRLISWYGYSRLRWRNAFGMFITGALAGFPPFLVCASQYAPSSLLFLLFGPAKALAYSVTHNTEISEWLNGGIRGLICGGVLYGWM